MSDYQSKYCYPGTDILINKFNIKDPSKLDNIEMLVTGTRLLELQNKAILGNFDLQHLQKIHAYIFQDIYDFAGQIRRENISKGFHFALALHIESSAKELFNDLKKEKRLSGMPKNEFSERAAYYMSEINVLHPFREGNGRTQREFIRTLALKNGYDLDWSKVDKDTILQTSILSKSNYKPLQEVISNCITNERPSLKLIKQYTKKTDFELER